MERGIRNISILKLHRIATSLGVRLRDLVDKCSEALNPFVYALQNCVSWVAFDVGELARCELPHTSQLQVFLARRTAS